MEEGFQKARTDNLPKVSEDMVMQFFAENQHFFSVEIRGVKAERTARSSYGDNAVGYVQVKRDGSLCITKARITPEHKVKSKAYSVMLVCDEIKENIISLQCDGCAASKGGCKHTVAFLFWIHRKCSMPSPTEVECYWKKSQLSAVGSNKKFVYASELGKKQVKALPPKNPLVLEECVAVLKEKKVDNLQLCNYFGEFNDLKKMSMNYLIVSFSSKNLGTTVNEFLNYIKCKLTPNVCEEVAARSLDQSKSNLWYELRYARITASKIHQASRCSTLDGSLVESILGAKFKPTEAMKRGVLLENAVLEKIKKKYDMKIQGSGLLLHADYPVFGASPDGLSDEFVIEVKCPVSEKNMNKYIVNDLPAEKHYAQLQTQMLFAQKQRGMFCVAHPDFEKNGRITEIFVNYDGKYCENLMTKALLFWKEAIYPVIYQNSL